MLDRYLNPEEPLILVLGFAQEADGHCFLIIPVGLLIA